MEWSIGVMAIFSPMSPADKKFGKTIKSLKFGGLVEFGLCFLRSIHTLQQLCMELQVMLERPGKLSLSAKIFSERHILVTACHVAREGADLPS
jgi:hypothetical protein